MKSIESSFPQTDLCFQYTFVLFHFSTQLAFEATLFECTTSIEKKSCGCSTFIHNFLRHVYTCGIHTLSVEYNTEKR